ncbi:MAG: hypothetical protein V4670_05380 [Bacteroidota bacterium]
MKQLILFFLFFVQSIFSQSVLKGKVVSDANPDGIMVVNYSTKVSTVTENGGFFTIEAKIGDKLVITSNRIDGIEIKLDSYSFQKEILYIRVKSKPNQLEEVQIKSISAKSMGLIDKNYKEMSKNERKLDYLYYSPIDLLFSTISGERRNLKRNIELEKKQKNIQKLQFLFPEDYYFETLKISKEALFGFLIYCMDDSQINLNLENKNKSNLKLRLVELAFRFKEMKNE